MHHWVNWRSLFLCILYSFYGYAERNAYKLLVGKPEGKRPLGRPRHRWEDNIKMGLREIGWEVLDRIHLAQDTDQWRGCCDTVMYLRVPLGGVISWLAEWLSSSQEGLCYMELLSYGYAEQPLLSVRLSSSLHLALMSPNFAVAWSPAWQLRRLWTVVGALSAHEVWIKVAAL
jgi:hypothetical protein